ncbi:type II secretion system protein N [Bordetella petrii]|uniref:Type II secretion system protein N n=1 Tax=Bordetella petrii (strain ATCC BAA-461 / DSM 12804 / CCUG 43448 / CIP 107267 / Se-1111R) TaxID=340100 RepID=A9IRQ8_BORPD|nr:type II secretion system protein N [Bordetella petrii]CAP43205.1 general secretion pathway protein N [Bordetella petrii]
MMRRLLPTSFSPPLAALALCCALLAALVVLPARWLLLVQPDDAMAALADADGTLWRGSARVALGPPGARRLLPEPLHWQWRHGALEISHAWLRGPVRAQPGWSGIAVSGQNLRLPAATLAAFGAPLNTVAPGGQLEIDWQPFVLGHLSAGGALATARWTNASSALSHVRPLGDYTLRITADQDTLRLALGTDSGVLSVTGQGRLRHGRLRLRGEAAPADNATPPQRAALAGLLSALGPVSNGKTHFSTPP